MYIHMWYRHGIMHMSMSFSELSVCVYVCVCVCAYSQYILCT